MEATFLSFSVHEKQYAVQVEYVLEVLEMARITMVPGSINEIVGTLNFRGEFLPVFDGHKTLLRETPVKKQKYVIIVFSIKKNSSTQTFALLVDKVLNVTTFDDASIQDLPEMNHEISGTKIKGAIHNENEFIFLLDIEDFSNYNSMSFS